MIPQPTSTTPPPPAPAGVPSGSASRRRPGGPATANARCAAGAAAVAGSKGWRNSNQPADGGKSQWFVRDDAEPGFARVRQRRSPPQRPGPPDGRPADAGARPAGASWTNGRPRSPRQSSRAGGGPKPRPTSSASSACPAASGCRRGPLQLWRDRYRRHGLDGLVDRRCQPDRTELRDDDDFLKELRGSTSHAPAEPASACGGRDARRAGAGLAGPLLLVLRPLHQRAAGAGADQRAARAGRLRRQVRAVDRTRLLDAAHERAVVRRPSPVRRDRERRRAARRPWLTAWMDMRSRRIVGWCIFATTPTRTRSSRALRAAAWTRRARLEVYMDNGKDFDCYALHGRTKWRAAAGRAWVDEAEGGRHPRGLGMGAVHCWAYHGQSKPIERFFGTMEDRFGKTLDTYCGNKPENKPEDLQRQLDKGKAPTLAEFTAAFRQWLAATTTPAARRRRHGRAEPAGGVRRAGTGRRSGRQPRSCWTCSLMKTPEAGEGRQERGHLAGAAVRPVRAGPDPLAGEGSLPPHRRTDVRASRSGRRTTS
jgi:hypothetical protein